LSVEPEESINPHIKVLLSDSTKGRLQIRSTFGSFEKILGSLDSNIDFSSSSDWMSVGKINQKLKNIKYTVKIYDARRLVDYIKVSIKTSTIFCEVEFPIEIRIRPLPILSFRQSSKIEDMVTIVTKTFMRYDCLERLLNSIKTFYPKIKMIVADDTPNLEYKKINTTEFPDVKQYKMPPSSGWFAGRALAISQVATPFFIWIDDDFLIDSQTDLRKFLDVIQKTGFDVISGALNANGRESSWAKSVYFQTTDWVGRTVAA